MVCYGGTIDYIVSLQQAEGYDVLLIIIADRVLMHFLICHAAMRKTFLSC